MLRRGMMAAKTPLRAIATEGAEKAAATWNQQKRPGQLEQELARGADAVPERESNQSIVLEQNEGSRKIEPGAGLSNQPSVRTRRAASEAMRRRAADRGWEESERAARQQVLAMEKTRRREFERVKERLKEEAKNAD